MVKQPPSKTLLYKGATYDAVELPKALLYRGAAYELVTAAEDDKETGRAVKDVLQTLKEKAPQLNDAEETSMEERLAPITVEEEKVVEEKAPPEKEEVPLLFGKELLNSLEPFVAELRKDVQGWLSKYGIDASGEIAVEADEADGIDMGVPIATKNFSALPNTSLSFDYYIRLPEEDLEALRARGLTDIEKEGFAGRILRNIKNLVGSNNKLQEVVLHFCNHGFVGTGNTVGELLDTVGFLQKKTQVRPGELLEVPEEEASEENIKEWVSEVFKQIIENEMHHHAGVDIFRKSQWGDIGKMKEVLKGLQAKNILGGDQVSVLMKFLGGLKPTEYASMIRDILTPTRATEKYSLRKVVEAKIAELTKHEQYKGEVKFGIADDGNIVAAIDAPYPFQYILKQRTGGKIELLHADTEICDFSFIVDTEQAAKDLLTASLNMADAYKRAVNPSVSQNRKEREKEELFLKIHDLSKKLHEQEGLEVEHPTEEESVGAQQMPGYESTRVQE